MRETYLHCRLSLACFHIGSDALALRKKGERHVCYVVIEVYHCFDPQLVTCWLGCYSWQVAFKMHPPMHSAAGK